MGKPYSPPVLSPSAQKAVTNGEFDFLLPLAKPLWRTDEVGTAIGRSRQFVRLLIDEGRLEAHQDNGRGERLRISSLVTRRSVVLYMAETANYDPAFFILRLEAALTKARAPTLDRLIATATRLRHQIR